MSPPSVPFTPSIEQIKDALANIGKLSNSIIELLPTLVGNVPSTPFNDTTSTVDTTTDGYISSNDSEGSITTDACQCAAHMPPKSPEPFLYYKETQEKKKKICTWNSRRQIYCRVCGKTVQVRNLKEHMNTHLMYKERPFRCVPCAKYYAYKKDLDRHMRTHHREIIH